MADTAERQRRHWADVAAILAGLMLMGLAIWPVPFVHDADRAGQVAVTWWIYALAGGLTLVGVFLGQRWERKQLARGLMIAAVAVLLYGLFTSLRGLGTTALLTAIVPGLLILLAIPFFGPMPRDLHR
jgi:hypothetical protein